MTMTVERMSRAEVEAALQHEIAVSREYGLVIVDLRAEIEQLREAVTRLLACPAIADENFSDPEWGCAETREAEAFARAALAGKEGKYTDIVSDGGMDPRK